MNLLKEQSYQNWDLAMTLCYKASMAWIILAFMIPTCLQKLKVPPVKIPLSKMRFITGWVKIIAGL